MRSCGPAVLTIKIILLIQTHDCLFHSDQERAGWWAVQWRGVLNRPAHCGGRRQIAWLKYKWNPIKQPRQQQPDWGGLRTGFAGAAAAGRQLVSHYRPRPALNNYRLGTTARHWRQTDHLLHTSPAQTGGKLSMGEVVAVVKAAVRAAAVVDQVWGVTLVWPPGLLSSPTSSATGHR